MSHKGIDSQFFLKIYEKKPDYEELLPHLGHFSPSVGYPHFWQWGFAFKLSNFGVFNNFTSKITRIKMPTPIPIQTSTI